MADPKPPADPKSSTTPTDDEAKAAAAIAALDETTRKGIEAMIERADDQLVESFERSVLTPVLRRLRNTRIALAIVVGILIGVCLYIRQELPTENDLANHGSVWSEDESRRLTLAERLDVIERWQVENTVTSPLGGHLRRTFTSPQSLLTALSEESGDSIRRLDSLDRFIKAMVPHLDCFTERTSDTLDEQGCYVLQCTLGDRTFTHPHRYDYATSSWSPCE